jgi:hypothetical protein
MKKSQRLIDQDAYVEKSLSGKVICESCGTTLGGYAENCTANLSSLCPGFMAIEDARAAFDADRKAAQ